MPEVQALDPGVCLEIVGELRDGFIVDLIVLQIDFYEA